MIYKKLLLDNRLKSKNKMVKFDYEKYIKACKLIAADIKKNFDIKDEIEIIGMARGGLPMLVTLSHLLGIREVSMIQTKMSNSDKCYDYGEFRYISDNVSSEKKDCILFEDIVYKGKTTDGVVDILKKRNKKILAVYALIIDENFKNIELKNKDTNLSYVFEIPKDDWVYFFWETDLNDIE